MKTVRSCGNDDLKALRRADGSTAPESFEFPGGPCKAHWSEDMLEAQARANLNGGLVRLALSGLVLLLMHALLTAPISSSQP